jgi:hypothetical protein
MLGRANPAWVAKRGLDITVGASALFLPPPLLLLIALAVWAGDGGKKWTAVALGTPRGTWACGVILQTTA